MGIIIFKIFIAGGILSDIGSEITFYGSAPSQVAVKLNLQPYIRQYTSPNENFESSYPLKENVTAHCVLLGVTGRIF